ncbi:MAG: RNA polymerase sigma factor [Alistipes sp.]|nr:RNA polymerase sigma factor [Candidatus Alistipes equi]
MEIKPLNSCSLLFRLRDVQTRNEAFDELVELYSERLYWHLRRFLVIDKDTEDALQETFVTAFLSIESFRSDATISLRSWMYKIATTQALKVLRTKRRGIFMTLDDCSRTLLSDVDTQSDPSADEIEIKLQKAVLKLPTKQRIAFNLRYFDALPFEEISKITGSSVGTLKTNYHYAVEKIKKEVSIVEI